jgi:hypothetical protein
MGYYPGVLSVGHPEIKIGVNGGWTFGDLAGDVKIESVPLHLEFELPNTLIKAELPDNAPARSAGDLMKKFQVGDTQGNGGKSAAINLGVLSNEALSVLGNIQGRRLLFYVALGHIKLGPGNLPTALSIDYVGGPDGQLSGQVWSQYDTPQKDSDDTLFSIMLAAAYDGPGQSWTLEGGATSGRTDPVTIKELIEAFANVEGIPDIFSKLGINYLHLLYETGPGNFEFQCDVEVKNLFGENVSVEMIVDDRLHKVGGDTGEPAQKTGGDADTPAEKTREQ